MAGLFWLEAGQNRVGSAPDSTVRLPDGSAHLGDLSVRDGSVFWEPFDGEEVELQTDRLGQPATVNHENWSFFVVDCDNRLAARLRDTDWASKRPFAGLDTFDYAPEWRLSADWQTLTPVLTIDVPTVTGELKSVLVEHQAVFAVGGQSVALLPMSVSDSEVFFVFRDRSSGKETYGAGRFLKANLAVDGKITLDFNFAFNPPCAFTPFALCPLPPPENWLPFAVPAGEKKPAGPSAVTRQPVSGSTAPCE